MIGHKQEAKAGGKTNEMSISGLRGPHGIGMQAVPDVAEPPFQQVLPFFPFFFCFVSPSLQNELC